MILYFRKGARLTELLLAKDTLRPGMLTKGYVFMVIESDARGHIGSCPASGSTSIWNGWQALPSGRAHGSFLTAGGRQTAIRERSSS